VALPPVAYSHIASGVVPPPPPPPRIAPPSVLPIINHPIDVRLLGRVDALDAQLAPPPPRIAPPPVPAAAAIPAPVIAPPPPLAWPPLA
jgi:hypothetical protein